MGILGPEAQLGSPLPKGLKMDPLQCTFLVLRLQTALPSDESLHPLDIGISWQRWSPLPQMGGPQSAYLWTHCLQALVPHSPDRQLDPQVGRASVQGEGLEGGSDCPSP